MPKEVFLVMVVNVVNPYDVAVAQFDEAADYLGLSQAQRAILRKPKRELVVVIGKTYRASPVRKSCDVRRREVFVIPAGEM